MARSAGVPLLVLCQTRCENDPDGVWHLDDRELDAIARSVEGPGVVRLSMRESLDGPDCHRLFADGSHLKQEGHELLARAIAAKIHEAGWAPWTEYSNRDPLI